MTVLSPSEKSLLRGGGHRATLYLSVLRPQSVCTAQVHMTSPERGARSIVYDNDIGASNVLAGMTLWVGSTAGACDVGKVRVRSINTVTKTITVSENNLVWADDQYLTVKRVWELWPVFPRFDSSGNFYKDYDIPYIDENQKLKPVATMGPPRAAFDDGSGTSFTFVDAGAGYAFRGATIVNRSWSVVGPGVYAWTADGPNRVLTITGANRFDDAHWVTLTVTDSNGKTQTTRRPVFCHERNGSHAPLTDFTLESLTGDWERGGWEARLRVYSGATADDFPDGTLVLLWHEASFGDNTTFIGGNYEHAKNVLFVGYVRGETVVQDWNTGDVVFEATTIDGLLRRSLMFSVPLKSISGSPDRWYEFAGPTVAEAVHHYWRWHSTLFDVADVYLPISNSLRAETIEDFAKGDLYSQADSFARHHGIFAHVCCNKLGQVYVAEDAQMLSDARRDTLPVVSDITAADRRDEITIIRRPEPRVGMVHLSGFAYPRTPIISKAPGDAPLDVGARVVHVERQILESQAQANMLAGRVLAAENNPYPEVRVKFAGHYLSALDIVPQEWWTLSLAADDTPRGIVWNNRRMMCRNVSASYDPAAGAILIDAVFEPEADGADGVDGDYPMTPPSESPAPPGPPVVPPTPPAASGRLAAFDHNLGHLNQTASGTWEARNSGAATIADNQGGFDPHWPTTQDSTDIEDAILWRVQDGHIYRSTDCGRSWSEVTGMGDPPNSWSDDPAPSFSACQVVMFTPNNYKDGELYFLVRWQNGNGDWRGWLLKCTGDGAAWVWRALGGGPPPGGAGYYSPVIETDYMPGSQGGYYITVSNRSNAIDGDTATFAEITGNQDGSGQTPLIWEFDLGGVATNCNDFEFYGRGDGDMTLVGNLFVSVNGVDWTQWTAYGAGNITINGTSTGWTRPAAGWTNGPHDVRYIRLNLEQTNNAFHWVKAMGISGFRVHSTGEFTPAGGGAVYPIWMDADTADGTYLYITACDADNNLTIQKRLINNLALVNELSLGTVYIAEIIDGTYAAYPRVREFDPNVVYVHGHLPDGSHLLRSVDAGGSFSAVPNEFDAASTIGFFIVGHDGTLWAVENTGSAPILWRDADGSGFVKMPAVPLSGNVPPDGMTIIPGTATMAMASSGAVIRTDDGGQTWSDQNYPPGGDIRSLLFIA